MKDYIDREYAIASLDRIKKRNARNKCMLSADEDAIKKWLMALPDSDVVEVVRCRDCKHYDRRTDVCHNPRWGDGWANYPPPSVNEDFFCADGAKMDK